MAVALSGALFAKCQEQIRPIDARAQRMSLAAPQPDEWHAVRHYQIRCVQNVLEGSILLSLDNTVHAGRSDGVASVTLANPFLHLRDHIGDLQMVHAYAQNSEAGVALKGLRCLSFGRHS